MTRTCQGEEGLKGCPQLPYRDMPGVSQSDLKLFATDAEEWLWRLAGRIPERKTKPMEFGHRLEAYLSMTPGDREIKIIPAEVLSADGARRGNKWKAWEKEAKETNPEAVLMTQKEYDSENAALIWSKDQIQAKPKAARILFEGKKQKFWWECPATGLLRKCELDYFLEARKLIGDLKTSVQVTAPAIRNTILEFGYEVQQVTYQQAVEVRCGERWPFVFVFVKSSPAHCVTTCQIDPKDRALQDAREWSDNEMRRMFELMSRFIDQTDGTADNGAHVFRSPDKIINISL
jgi:hypothetical protein